MGLGENRDALARQWPRSQRQKRMLASELAGRTDGRSIAQIDDLMVGDVKARIVAVASRVEDAVVCLAVVVVDALGQQYGQDIPQR